MSELLHLASMLDHITLAWAGEGRLVEVVALYLGLAEEPDPASQQALHILNNTSVNNLGSLGWAPTDLSRQGEKRNMGR